MKIKIRLIAFCCLVLSSSSWGARQLIKTEVKGIKNSVLLKNIQLHLSQIDNEEADGSDRYKYLVTQNVDKALRAEGYYNSTFNFTSKKNNKLTLDIKLNNPVKLNKRNIDIKGKAKQDADFISLIKEEVPKKGTILNHSTYDNFKSKLENLAQNKGYFDSHWLYHRLEIYPREYLANWQLGYDSGERYHYGKISFKNSQIDPSYLDNILKIKQGNPYLMSDLSDLANDLSSSKWFSTVLVDPKMDKTSKLVNLDILLQPKKKNQIEIGIGYETDVGPHLQLNWKKPWINDAGRSIESSMYISKPKQTFAAAYNMPIKSNPLNYYSQLATSLEHEDQNDTRYTAATLGFQRFWNKPHSWSYSAGLKLRYDKFEQGNDNYKTFLVYPTSSFKRIRSDGKRFPKWGDSQKITINYGNKIWKSDVNFYSIKASSAWVRTYYDNHRIYLRAELGYLKTKNFNRIPSALRFFAGGDNSVRGFSYKSISPRDKENKLIGGSHLVTATAEYQYQVYPNWWGAVFYDTGFAADNFNKKNLRSGAGVGIRWASPIGAIKFDVATPLKSPDDKKGIHFYIGLGSEL
ncbi:MULTISPECIES: autotransporter assembly complex protein TamA [Pasteurellaceae]|uniref:Translocation and assembly module subunit TamA n=1 Tax=Pasteurella atlantica TaxID=2827233 RepID=A0AAW8CFE2_9PAST|nr:autotransporter assembly complex family protein [Pasteurella atlantica]MBR0572871.1 outer membrane protein assembly factor [Pasteurella atlantica]MDP8038799.1 autotransporter assembly complex family protein [Pasteurella atlantica]MDP8040890.1 autotransporter assembly complex family protein [Pasteurella atlantica]MDP8042936.1 autotransporter assembly complex family protein [Pasteurella atlantica]MDP8045023.1 autotransporter assembly complex family protein [Pasteurella atlantica]